MVTIGSKLNLNHIGTATVTGFYNHTEPFRRHRVKGVYAVTETGHRIPVGLKRGAEYRLEDGTTGTV